MVALMYFRSHTRSHCDRTSSVQFGIQSLDRFGRRGDMTQQFSRDSLPVFSAGGPCWQFQNGQECPLFDIVHPAISLQTTASPTLQGAPKGGFGEAVVACDMPELCEFPSLDSCRERLFGVVHPAFPLPTTASPTLQDALKKGFGEAVVILR